MLVDFRRLPKKLAWIGAVVFLTTLVEWYNLFIKVSSVLRKRSHINEDIAMAIPIGSVLVAAVCILLVFRPSVSVVGTAFCLTVLVAAHSTSVQFRRSTDRADDVLFYMAVAAAIILGGLLVYLLMGRRAAKESSSELP